MDWSDCSVSNSIFVFLLGGDGENGCRYRQNVCLLAIMLVKNINNQATDMKADIFLGKSITFNS